MWQLRDDCINSFSYFALVRPTVLIDCNVKLPQINCSAKTLQQPICFIVRVYLFRVLLNDVCWTQLKISFHGRDCGNPLRGQPGHETVKAHQTCKGEGVLFVENPQCLVSNLAIRFLDRQRAGKRMKASAPKNLVKN